MTDPIQGARTAPTIPERSDDERRADRAPDRPKPSVADAWQRFEETGSFASGEGVPDGDCLDAGAEAHDGCMQNAHDACGMFPYMGTIAGGGLGRLAGRQGAWLGGVAGNFVGNRMKNQCLDVSDVQCRTKESRVIEQCMEPRQTPVPHYAPEDFPVASPDEDAVPHFTPEDFRVVDE